MTHTGQPTLNDGKPDPCGILIPLADMLNHSPILWSDNNEGKIDEISVKEQSHVVWRTTAAGLECVSTKEMEVDSEILFSYGNHSNGRCFITVSVCCCCCCCFVISSFVVLVGCVCVCMF